MTFIHQTRGGGGGGGGIESPYGLTEAELSDADLVYAWRAQEELIGLAFSAAQDDGPAAASGALTSGERVVSMKDASRRGWPVNASLYSSAPIWETGAGSNFTQAIRFNPGAAGSGIERLAAVGSTGAEGIEYLAPQTAAAPFTMVVRFAFHTSPFTTVQSVMSTQAYAGGGFIINSGGALGNVAFFFHGGSISAVVSVDWSDFTVAEAITFAVTSDGTTASAFRNTDFSTAETTAAVGTRGANQKPLNFGGRDGEQGGDMSLLGVQFWSRELSQAELERADTWIQDAQP